MSLQSAVLNFKRCSTNSNIFLTSFLVACFYFVLFRFYVVVEFSFRPKESLPSSTGCIWWPRVCTAQNVFIWNETSITYEYDVFIPTIWLMMLIDMTLSELMHRGCPLLFYVGAVRITENHNLGAWLWGNGYGATSLVSSKYSRRAGRKPRPRSRMP